MEGDYGKLDFLKVNEILAENPRDKTITVLATDKEEPLFSSRSNLLMLLMDRGFSPIAD